MFVGELESSCWLGCVFGGKCCVLCEQVEEMFVFVGLDYVLGKYFYELFGGMQQCLVLVQVLIKKLCILLLDEFFGVLDSGICWDMYELVLDLWWKQDLIVFMIIYDLVEGFFLGICMWVFDKEWLDFQIFGSYGVWIIYDLFVGNSDKGILQLIIQSVDFIVRVLGV